jgi:hypothetical protein
MDPSPVHRTCFQIIYFPAALYCWLISLPPCLLLGHALLKCPFWPHSQHFSKPGPGVLCPLIPCPSSLTFLLVPSHAVTLFHDEPSFVNEADTTLEFLMQTRSFHKCCVTQNFGVQIHDHSLNQMCVGGGITKKFCGLKNSVDISSPRLSFFVKIKHNRITYQPLTDKM